MSAHCHWRSAGSFGPVRAEPGHLLVQRRRLLALHQVAVVPAIARADPEPGRGGAVRQIDREARPRRRACRDSRTSGAPCRSRPRRRSGSRRCARPRASARRASRSARRRERSHWLPSRQPSRASCASDTRSRDRVPLIATTAPGSTVRSASPMTAAGDDAERERLDEDMRRVHNWRRWGPYLAERQWGTVREDYSADRRVLDLLAARSRAQPRLPLGRGRPARHLRSRVPDVLRARAVERPRSDPQGAAVRASPAPRATTARTARSSTTTSTRRRPSSYLKALYKYPHEAYPVRPARRREPPARQGRSRVRDRGHRRVRSRLLGRHRRVREGRPRRHR